MYKLGLLLYNTAYKSAFICGYIADLGEFANSLDQI